MLAWRLWGDTIDDSNYGLDDLALVAVCVGIQIVQVSIENFGLRGLRFL